MRRVWNNISLCSLSVPLSAAAGLILAFLAVREMLMSNVFIVRREDRAGWEGNLRAN